MGAFNMTRAEMRRQKRESEKEHTITYNLTKAQLDQMVNSLVQKQISEAKREAADEAINTALALFLGLPLCVLMDEYWKKSYTQKLPGFTDKVIEYYEAWQDGKLSLDEIKDKLWKYGGVRLKAEKVMV
jgi:hypothetical protein